MSNSESLSRAEGSLLGSIAISSHQNRPQLAKYLFFPVPYLSDKNFQVDLVSWLEVRAENREILKKYPLVKEILKLDSSEKSIKSINSMLKCGELTGYGKLECCGDKLFIPLRYECNLRTCPTGADKRKKRIRKQYLPILEKFSANPRDYNSLRFLTISPDNYEDTFEGLKRGFKEIRRNFSKFIRNKYISDRVLSGLCVIEMKNKNKDGECKGWNIHLHILYYGQKLDNRIRGHCNNCGQNYMKYSKVEGKYYCGSSKCHSFDVEVKNKDSKIVQIWNRVSGRDVNIRIEPLYSREHYLNYLLKYISANKDDFRDVASMAQYIVVTRGQKLITKFGDIFGKKIPVIKNQFFCDKCNNSVALEYDSNAEYEMEHEAHSHNADEDKAYDLKEITEKVTSN